MNNAKVDFLYLSEPDMIKAGVLDMPNCVRVVNEVFELLGKGDYLMAGPQENSHGTMLWFPEEKRGDNMPVAGFDRRFMSMIAYLGGRFNLCGDKWYGSNVANKEKGLPRSILNITLNDVDTGAPICYCSGNLVSAMRTGAVPGVGAKYLQAEGASVIGVIGAGVISKACLLAIAETLKDKKEARVYDLFPERAASFCEEMKELLDLDLLPVNTLEEAVRDCDIISVATSGAAAAEIRGEWLKEGAVVILTGVAKIPDETYLNSRVVMDNWKMHEEWLNEGLAHADGLDSLDGWAASATVLKLYHAGKITLDDLPSLGDIIVGKAEGRRDNRERIIFITGGMPVEDVAWAYEVYQNAVKLGLGQKLTLWEKPHWS